MKTPIEISSFPTWATQALQVAVQNNVIRRVLGSTKPLSPPWPLKLARLVGVGFRPEHVRLREGPERKAVLISPATYLIWYIYLAMGEEQEPQKIPLIFFRTPSGGEPVREWLKDLVEAERLAIGKDLLRAQWRWPVGMPLCRPMGKGLWEVRTDLAGNRTARVLICVYLGHLVALHGFIKKTRVTPADDLALARKRQKETEQ